MSLSEELYIYIKRQHGDKNFKGDNNKRKNYEKDKKVKKYSNKCSF